MARVFGVCPRIVKRGRGGPAVRARGPTGPIGRGAGPGADVRTFCVGAGETGAGIFFKTGGEGRGVGAGCTGGKRGTGTGAFWKDGGVIGPTGVAFHTGRGAGAGLAGAWVFLNTGAAGAVGLGAGAAKGVGLAAGRGTGTERGTLITGVGLGAVGVKVGRGLGAVGRGPNGKPEPPPAVVKLIPSRAMGCAPISASEATQEGFLRPPPPQVQPTWAFLAVGEGRSPFRGPGGLRCAAQHPQR